MVGRLQRFNLCLDSTGQALNKIRPEWKGRNLYPKILVFLPTHDLWIFRLKCLYSADMIFFFKISTKENISKLWISDSSFYFSITWQMELFLRCWGACVRKNWAEITKNCFQLPAFQRKQHCIGSDTDKNNYIERNTINSQSLDNARKPYIYKQYPMSHIWDIVWSVCLMPWFDPDHLPLKLKEKYVFSFFLNSILISYSIFFFRRREKQRTIF